MKKCTYSLSKRALADMILRLRRFLPHAGGRYLSLYCSVRRRDMPRVIRCRTSKRSGRRRRSNEERRAFTWRGTRRRDVFFVFQVWRGNTALVANGEVILPSLGGGRRGQVIIPLDVLKDSIVPRCTAPSPLPGRARLPVVPKVVLFVVGSFSIMRSAAQP